MPGAEFRVAYDEAMKYGGRVILGDRPVNVRYSIDGFQYTLLILLLSINTKRISRVALYSIVWIRILSLGKTDFDTNILPCLMNNDWHFFCCIIVHEHFEVLQYIGFMLTKNLQTH